MNTASQLSVDGKAKILYMQIRRGSLFIADT